jgi:hypothetical protein
MFEFPPKLKSQALDLSLGLQRPNFFFNVIIFLPNSLKNKKGLPNSICQNLLIIRSQSAYLT